MASEAYLEFQSHLPCWWRVQCVTCSAVPKETSPGPETFWNGVGVGVGVDVFFLEYQLPPPPSTVAREGLLVAGSWGQWQLEGTACS